MKKIRVFFVFLILICMTILSGCTKPESTNVMLKSNNTKNADTRWENIIESGIIDIGVEVQGLPYIDKKSNGEYIGFLADLADAIAEKADIKANFVEIDTSKIPSLLKDNTIDIVMNGYTEADTINNQLKWLQPYIINHCIIVCNKYSEIESKNDLSGKKTGVVDDTLSHITALSDVNINNDELIKYYNEKKALAALSNGNINALIIEDSYFYYYQKNNSSNYKVLDEIIYTNTRSIGLDKSNVKMYEKLQNIITELNDDGTLEKISKKWFGTNLTK